MKKEIFIAIVTPTLIMIGWRILTYNLKQIIDNCEQIVFSISQLIYVWNLFTEDSNIVIIVLPLLIINNKKKKNNKKRNKKRRK